MIGQTTAAPARQPSHNVNRKSNIQFCFYFIYITLRSNVPVRPYTNRSKEFVHKKRKKRSHLRSIKMSECNARTDIHEHTRTDGRTEHKLIQEEVNKKFFFLNIKKTGTNGSHTRTYSNGTNKRGKQENGATTPTTI